MFHLIGVAALLALATCSKESAINLDGKTICPPAQAVLGVPLWLKSVKGLDTSYADVLLSIEPHSVIVANESAISGRSATQEELLRVAASGKAQFEPIEGTTFYKVWARPEFPNLGWEVVRWPPKGAEGKTPLSLTQWIVGHCSLINDSQSCLVQRIHSGLAYEFYYRGPLSHLDETTSKIEQRLDQWQSNCAKDGRTA